MRLRLFFILLFACSVAVSGLYSIRFFREHPGLSAHIDERFVLLICLAVVLQMCGHFVRAYKSRFLLDHIRTSRVFTLFQGLSVGNLFNSLLPFRLGEFIRAFYVGDALSISKTTVFMSIIIERLVDGVILGGSFLTGGLVVQHVSHPAFVLLVRLGGGLLVFASFLALFIYILKSENRYVLRTIHALTAVFNDQLRNRLRFMAWSGVYGTQLMLNDGLSLAKYGLLSLVMWFLYFCSIASIAVAFFANIGFGKLWFAVQSSYAGISTPAGPGYIGTFHLVVVRILAKVGIAASGFSIVMWLVMIVPISLVGLSVLIKQRFEKKQEAPNQEALINKLHREKDISAELGHFLDAYFQGQEINKVLTRAELDEKFKLIKSFKGGSNAHTVLVWQNQELFVKKIALPQYMDKLKDQAEWLTTREQLKHLPKIASVEENDRYYCFDLVYQEDFFPFFEFIHSRSVQASFTILKKITRFMNKDIYEPKSVKSGTKNVLYYIDQKVIGKVNDAAAMNGELSQLLAHKKIFINGVLMDNLIPAINKIRQTKAAMKDLGTYKETPIHGDLTVDNIITSANGDFMVLDPNNENQVSTPAVDIGKLYQSLHSGYEFLIQLEQCDVSGNSIKFEESKSQKYAEIFGLFDAKLKKDLSSSEYRTILFHEAVHYCRMLTYRAHINPETLPVFYGVAVQLLNEFRQQYAKS